MLLEIFKRKIKLVTWGGIAGVWVLGSIIYVVRTTGAKTQPIPAPTSSTNSTMVIATVGDNQIDHLDSFDSWPGEVNSLDAREIQPPREGTISEWNVNIGQKVYQWQVLGRLSQPPASPELIKMLAEQKENLERMRSGAKASSDFIDSSRKQLLALRNSLEKAQSANTEVLDLNQVSDSSLAVQSGKSALDQANGMLSLRQNKLRSLMDQIFSREILMLTIANSLDQFQYGRIKDGYGSLDANTRNVFETQAGQLANQLRNPSFFPLDVMSGYLKTAFRLVTYSSQTDSLMLGEIEAARKMINDDQNMFLDAQNDYKESKIEVAMKESEYKKMQTEYKLMGVEKNKEFAEQIRDIEMKLADLDKEFAVSQGEVKAAEVSYATVAGSINGGLTIMAPKSGVVAGIYKKPGDFVGPGMAVAVINSSDNRANFVRFRIPNNSPLPKVGDQLMMIRPSFPNEMKTLKLLGISSVLDSSGNYVADAKFMEATDWPIHVSVRVMPVRPLSSGIAINFSAIQFNENGESYVWLVTEEGRIRQQAVNTGKTVGNSIEILQGLTTGSRYLSQPAGKLKAGMLIGEIKKDSAPKETKKIETDLHGGMDTH